MNQQSFGTTKIIAAIRDAIGALERLTEQADAIAAAAQLIQVALRAKHKVMLCGNGGSAADSQHLAAELIGRFKRDRDPIPALALTADTSALTAIANDYGFAEVFSRQLRGLGLPGDVLIAISTSGRSPNIISALRAAREMAIRTIGLTGIDGGEMSDICDICIRAPAQRTDAIQQLHITIGHIVCSLVEEET